MATPRPFVFAVFVAVLLSCTHTSSGARLMPDETETSHVEPLAGPPLSAPPEAQPTRKSWWLPIWVQVLPKNLQSLYTMIPESDSAPSSALKLYTSSAQPMFMGFPGFDFGFPSSGYPRMGLPRSGFPGFGFPGMGGFPEPIVPPI